MDATNDRGPLDATSGGGPILPEWIAARSTWAFVALGVTLRVVRYLLNHPLWGDEAFVAANFLDRGYRDLLEPPVYGQVCPLLFLWIERTAVKFLGFSEWSLRLFPTLCAVGSIFLFRFATSLVFRGLPLLLSVAIFSVSFYPIRHGGEVKPYASDLLVALALLTLALAWWREPSRARWPWLLTAFAPIAVAISHPAVFVAGGIGLAMAATAWEGRRSGTWFPFLAFNLATAITFLGLFVSFTADQTRSAIEGSMRVYWANAFPPRGGLLALMRWLVEVHTGHLFAYPAGGDRGLSGLTVVCVLGGAVVLARRGRATILALAIAPFGLNLMAAALEAYPYGRSPRIMQHVAPATCMLAGLGAAALLSRPRSPGRRARLTKAALIGLSGGGVGMLVADIVSPCRSPCDLRSREFARWLWGEKGRDAEMACLKSDFGLMIDRRRWECGRSAVYLCNQWIYSDRRRRREPLHLDRVSADHPLFCILYKESPGGAPAFAAWLDRMSARYDLRSRARFDVNAGIGRVGDLEDRYEVFEFVPRPGGPSPEVAGVPPETGPRL